MSMILIGHGHYVGVASIIRVPTHYQMPFILISYSLNVSLQAMLLRSIYNIILRFVKVNVSNR
jgi:hypothetical protein